MAIAGAAVSAPSANDTKCPAGVSAPTGHFLFLPAFEMVKGKLLKEKQEEPKKVGSAFDSSESNSVTANPANAARGDLRRNARGHDAIKMDTYAVAFGKTAGVCRMEEAKKDLVTIELFQDAGEYADDVRVIVNGVVYTIKRGVPVQVPRFVAEVIEASARQDKETVSLIRAKENEYNSLKDQKIL